MTTFIILLALINMIHFTTVDELPDQRDHQLYITVDRGICLNAAGDGQGTDIRPGTRLYQLQGHRSGHRRPDHYILRHESPE